MTNGFIEIIDIESLDQFLAQKDEILAGEEFPDENKYYTD